MATTKRVGLGVTLGVDIAGGTTFVVLGAIVDHIDGADAKTEVFDSSLLTDKYVTKGGAQVDPGQVTYVIAYDPLDTGTTTILTALLTNSNIANWQVTYPVIGSEIQQKETFLGLVSGFKRTINKNKMITAEVTLSVSGKPGFTGN